MSLFLIYLFFFTFFKVYLILFIVELIAALLVNTSIQNINSTIYVVASVLYGLDLIYNALIEFSMIIALFNDSYYAFFAVFYSISVIFKIIIFIALLVHYKEFRARQMPLQPITPAEVQ